MVNKKSSFSIIFLLPLACLYALIVGVIGVVIYYSFFIGNFNSSYVHSIIFNLQIVSLFTLTATSSAYFTRNESSKKQIVSTIVGIVFAVVPGYPLLIITSGTASIFIECFGKSQCII